MNTRLLVIMQQTGQPPHCLLQTVVALYCSLFLSQALRDSIFSSRELLSATSNALLSLCACLLFRAAPGAQSTRDMLR